VWEVQAVQQEVKHPEAQEELQPLLHQPSVWHLLVGLVCKQVMLRLLGCMDSVEVVVMVYLAVLGVQVIQLQQVQQEQLMLAVVAVVVVLQHM
jgi:hypothetical protein